MHASGPEGVQRSSRGLIALGVVALAFATWAPLQVLLASSASAQVGQSLLGGATPKPTVTLNPGSPGTSLSSSSPEFAGSAVPGDQGGVIGAITSVKVEISSSAGHPGASFSLTPQPPVSGSSAWTFAGGPASPLTYNGPYQATITVTETDTGVLGNPTTGTTAISVSFAEDVPPIPPQGVSATVSSSPVPGVAVSWSANPEPDILGYDVLRSQGGSAPQSVGTTSATTFEDGTTTAGTRYTYEVVALRSGGAAGQSLLSPASSPATVAIPAATTPSVTTSPGKTKPTTATTAPSAAAKALASAAKSDLAGSGIPRAGSGGATGGAINPTGPITSSGPVGIAAPAAPNTTATTAPSTAGNSGAVGGPTGGGFSGVLPYPKAGGGAAAAGPIREPGPTSKPNSRARTLATVALGMIFLVVATLVIRLVLKTSKR